MTIFFEGFGVMALLQLPVFDFFLCTTPKTTFL